MVLLVTTDNFPTSIWTVDSAQSSVAQEHIAANHIAALLAAHVCLPSPPSLLSLSRTIIVLAVPATLASLALVLPPRRTVLLLVPQRPHPRHLQHGRNTSNPCNSLLKLPTSSAVEYS